VITAPEQWQEVRRLLSAALERKPSERSAYLDQVCTEPSVRQEVESLIAGRADAKKARNFARADQIREQLLEQGIVLEDTKSGVRWKRK